MITLWDRRRTERVKVMLSATVEKDGKAEPTRLANLSAEGALLVGSQATYVVEVTNAGPTDDPGPITLTDVLPVGLRYVDATGAGWTCTAAANASCAASSARSKSPTTPMRVATIRPQSVRYSSSTAEAASEGIIKL